MSKDYNQLPIGIFDSGVGGISVLGEMMRKLPREKFIYFADSINAPYGTKDSATVARLTLNAAEFLMAKRVKALVVACNTATAVAVNKLRDTLSLPVIGMEPAVKPAIELGKEGRILVMATPVTLQQDRFNRLLHRFDEQARVLPLPCPGLVELVEAGKTEGRELEEYLAVLFSKVPLDKIAVVVLGCTHYVFVADSIAAKMSPGTSVIDGNCGTAKHLKVMLEQRGLEAKVSSVSGDRVRFYTSGESSHVIPLCRRLLDIYDNKKYNNF